MYPDDEEQSMFLKSIGQYKPGQLGAGVTIGNPQAQQEYSAAQLGQLLEQYKAAMAAQEQAQGLMQSQYAPNSGALGSLAMAAQAFAGKRVGEREGKRASELSGKLTGAQAVLEEARATREANRKIRLSQDERKAREVDADQFGLKGDARTKYVLEGKLPSEVRDRMQAVQGENGFVAANLDRGTWSPLRYEDSQQQQQPREPIRTAFDGPDDERAAFDAMVAEDQKRGAPGGNQRYDNLTSQRPLMPYEKPPSPIEIERLNLQRESATRAGEAADDARALRNEAADNKRNTAYETENKAVGKARETVRLLDDALSHTGRSTGTGLSSMLDPRNFIPGTDAKDFGVRREQLQGRAFLEAFESLKGGGQITQIEGEKATAAMARLNAAQSDKEWQAAALELREIAARAAKSAEARSGRYAPQGAMPATEDRPQSNRVRIKL